MESLTIFYIIYGGCAFLNFVISILGMWFTSNNRFLTKIDIAAQAFLLVLGPIGTIIIIVALSVYYCEKAIRHIQSKYD